MENPQAPPSDRISNLPDELIVRLLTYLPIQEAARTSVLSTFWRDRWHDSPQLVFDALFQDSMGRRPMARIIEIIDQIISSHRTPILNFSLSLSGPLNYPEINPLINRVLERGPVLKFTLNPPGPELHVLPPELYFCHQLTHLNLWHCLFEPPPGFNGFRSLISLVLTDSCILITSDVLSHLISNCPQIEQLRIEGFHTLGSFKIVSPKLKYLFLSVPLTKVELVYAPLLSAVVLDMGLAVEARLLTPKIVPDLIGFHRLHAVESLHLDYHCIQGLTARAFETPFACLEILQIFGFAFEAMDVLPILPLINNCPNLKTLSIEAIYMGDAPSVQVKKFYEDVVRSSGFYFNTMKKIEIVDLAGSVMEMEFIKFVLRRSPVLQKMDLVLDSSPDVDRVWMTLTPFFLAPSLSPSLHITLWSN